MKRTPATAVPAALALLTLTACLGEEGGGGTTPINGATGDAGTGGTPSGGGGTPSGTGGEASGGTPSGNGGTPSGNGGTPSGNGGTPSGNGGTPSGGGGEPGAGGFQPVDCGSGFGETARRWSLPFPLVDSPGLASRSHLVMDLTGDGIPDLLVYEPSILPEPDARVGRAYWLVYPGGAAGFADEPLRFTLPFSLETINALGEWSNENFIITDLTGDTRPDFVVLRPEGDPDGDARVSRAWWLVYENTGAGFSTEAKRHALPYPLDADWQSSAFASQHHTVFSLDDDRRPDFLEFRDGEAPTSEPRLGRAFWHLYRHSGEGFAGEPTRFTLPFDLTDRAGDRADPSTPAHLLLALRGPASNFRPEFVVTADEERPQADPRLGRARWDIYTNGGTGFASAPEPFTLPFPLDEAPGAYVGGFGSNAHAVLDLTGDGLPDLVVHRLGVSPDDDPLIGRAHWLLYRNTGDGFGDAPERWSLPVPLSKTGDDSASAPSTRSHALMRLAEPCAAMIFFDDSELPESDARLGRAYWTYYLAE
jgi:hypothetical protein